MAERVRIPVEVIPANGGGLALTGVDADANGMVMANDGSTILTLVNTDSVAHGVTVNAVPDLYGRTRNTIVEIPAADATSGVVVLGPFPRGLFNEALGNDLTLDFTDPTDIRCFATRASAASTVLDDLAIATPTPDVDPGEGTVGIAYTLDLPATGGSGVYSFSSVGDPLPDGLSLTTVETDAGAVGRVSGTPSVDDTFTGIVIEVSDGYTTAQTEAFNITINPGGT